MTNYSQQVQKLLASMDSQEQDTHNQPEDIQDIYVLIVREHEADTAQVVESSPAPVTPQQDSFLSAYLFVCFSLFLVLSTLVFQLYCIFNPLIATVTIIPTSQHITLSGT